MCSIIAFKGKLPKGLLTQLLVESEYRGKDSTGIAFREKNIVSFGSLTKGAKYKVTKVGPTTNFSSVGGPSSPQVGDEFKASSSATPANWGGGSVESYTTVAYRQALPAHTFCKRNSKHVGEARKSNIGIAHTRRASPGMPVNNHNAHPFVFDRVVYAHNGRVENWTAIKDKLIAHYGQYGDDTSKKLVLEYSNAKTDSIVLGPYIAQKNLAEVKGCYGLVWICRENVYCLRSAK
jgi:glucosamine 6-phosphate synthetase-like amidotransferase/phosphosugar isomerase protein